MSGVFRNIDPPPPPHRPASVYPPHGRTHSLGGEVGGGSIVRKTPDTALHYIYVSTFWLNPKATHHRILDFYKRQVWRVILLLKSHGRRTYAFEQICSKEDDFP